MYRLFVRILTKVCATRDFINYLDPIVLLGISSSSLVNMNYTRNVLSHHDGDSNHRPGLNSAEVMCPYELNGVCKDEYCKYWHMESGFRQKISSTDITLGRRRGRGRGPLIMDEQKQNFNLEEKFQGNTALDQQTRMSISSKAADDMSISSTSSNEEQVTPSSSTVIGPTTTGFNSLDEFISLPSMSDINAGGASSDKNNTDDGSSSSSSCSSLHIDTVDEALPLHQLLRERYLVEFHQFDDCSNHAIVLLIISGYFELVKGTSRQNQRFRS